MVNAVRIAHISFNPFPNDKFHSSKLKEFADNYIKFEENGIKFSKKLKLQALEHLYHSTGLFFL